MMRFGKPAPWETCQTFSGSWGYHRDQTGWKTPRQCVELLVRAVSSGGNLIMNVGPTGRGNFDGRACARLDAYAKWMQDNSRSIYGCTAAPEEFGIPGNLLLTYNADRRRVYLHMLDYSTKVELPFADRVEYAQLLNDQSEVEIKQGALLLPPTPPSEIIPVVELILKSPVGRKAAK